MSLAIRFNAVLFSLWLLPAWVMAADCQLRIGFNSEPIPPYIESAAPSAGPRGSAFALVEQAAHEVGCLVQWQSMPALRILYDAAQGQIDGAFFFSWTTERSRQLVYPEHQGRPDPGRRIATLNYALYKQVGSPVRWNGKELEPGQCIVGYNTGWSVGNDLLEFSIKTHTGKSAGALLNLLAKGRICAYATLEESGDAAIRAYPGQFEKLAPPLSRKDYYLAFNPAYYQAHQALIEALWMHIGKLRQRSHRAHQSN